MLRSTEAARTFSQARTMLPSVLPRLTDSSPRPPTRTDTSSANFADPAKNPDVPLIDRLRLLIPTDSDGTSVAALAEATGAHPATVYRAIGKAPVAVKCGRGRYRRTA